MKLKQLQKALAVGVLAVTSSYTFAAPMFSFTEYAGFQGGDVAVASYADPITGPAGELPSGAANLYSEMSWVNGNNPDEKSYLTLETRQGALLANTWTTISVLTHENNIIPNVLSWSGQDIIGRLRIVDSDGGAVELIDSQEPITIALNETENTAPCVFATPNNSVCDDFFTFTASGLNSFNFFANDGSEWLAEFGFGELDNAVFQNGLVYTAEDEISSISVQIRVTAVQVPEPATLGMFGLGLLGLGIAKRRKQNV